MDLILTKIGNFLKIDLIFYAYFSKGFFTGTIFDVLGSINT